MKILIVSDTHGRDGNLELAVEKEAPFDRLIHCGDVEGREDFIEALADCPCYIVAGNNDFFSSLPRELEIVISRCRCFITHGHYYGVSLDTGGLVDEARVRKCQAVFFGHTHRPMVREQDGILVINPGSLSFPRQEGRKPSYVVLEIRENKKMQAEIRYL